MLSQPGNCAAWRSARRRASRRVWHGVPRHRVRPPAPITAGTQDVRLTMVAIKSPPRPVPRPPRRGGLRCRVCDDQGHETVYYEPAHDVTAPPAR